jgi:hypothetical protein
MKTSKLFADFKKVTTQCELRRTLQFTIDRASYRVEVLYCYSNPKSPWSALAYYEPKTGWKSVADFPWLSEKGEDGAIRTTLNFLEDLHR